MKVEVFTSYHNIVSPLGFTSKENYDAVLNGNTGVKLHRLGKLNESFCLAAISPEKITAFKKNYVGFEKLSKLELLSIISIQDVLDRSKISLGDKKTLLIYSTTKGNIDALESSHPEKAYLNNLANTIGNYFNAANTPLVLSNACISGLLAIVMAKRLIEAGQYNTIVICGGDIISEFTVSGFKSFNALSNEASKPFDKNRTGINLGEAVATIIITNDKRLVSEDSAYVVAGAGANDANHISGPSRTGDGLFLSLQRTLKDNKEEIGFINAHGTATPFNDDMESVAFERFGLTNIPVNSLKGYYGHTLGAAGVLETIISLQALHNDQLIYSAGFKEKGLAGNIEIIEKNKTRKMNAFLKTASGFGGCNAAVLFRKI